MKSSTIINSIAIAIGIALIAVSSHVKAGLFGMDAGSSDTVMATSIATAAEESVLLASASFSISEPSMLAPENGDQLAAAVLPTSDLPKHNLLMGKSKGFDITTAMPEKIAKPTTDRVAAQQKRAGFTLAGLFRSQGEHSLLSFFVCMAFIGIVVAGARLEFLRRKYQQDAFYGSELINHHRQHRPRSKVIYVQTSPSPTRSSGTRRRRRRSSSHSHSHHRSSSHRRRSHRSTHPVTVEGRLAG